MSQRADVELKILQNLLSLVSSFPPCTIDCLQTCVLQFQFRAAPFSCSFSSWMMIVEYAPVVLQALVLCFELLESRMAVVSSTAAPTLRQLVVDNEDCPLLLASKLDSIPLPD